MSQSNAEIFRVQQRHFERLFAQVYEGPKATPILHNASPKRVLTFAEGLLLCRTEAEALIHIEQDREAAAFFRMRSGDVARASDSESALNAKEVSIREGPFGLLSELLLKSFRLSVEDLDERWNKPGDSQAFVG